MLRVAAIQRYSAAPDWRSFPAISAFQAAPFAAFSHVPQTLARLVQGGLERPLPAGGFSPAELHRCLAQRNDEGTFCTGRDENVLLEIAAVDHMIPGTRILSSKSTRHSSDSAGASEPRQLRSYPIRGVELPWDSFEPR